MLQDSNDSVALSPHEERIVAVKAGTDPRTVRRYRKGLPVHSTSAERIRAALDEYFAGRRRPWVATHTQDGRTLVVDAFSLVGARLMAAKAWGCGTSLVRATDALDVTVSLGMTGTNG
jgi:hypothetical protein